MSAQPRSFNRVAVRLSASPGMARQLVVATASFDVTDCLPRLAVPAFVARPVGEAWISASSVRYLADHIPDAEYLEVPGDDHWPWAADPRPLLCRISGFLDRLV